MELAKKYRKVLVAEEASVIGGLGSAVADIISRKVKGKVDFTHIGIPDDFVTHGPRELLLEKCRLSTSGLVEAVSRMCRPKSAASMTCEVTQSLGTGVEGVTQP